MHSTTEHLISTAEAAELARVNRSTFTRWVASGRISPALQAPAYRGAMFFDRADVEALIADLERGSAA